jgi:ubiquinone/menaquinone biosynthesis C-methylase UbiE
MDPIQQSFDAIADLYAAHFAAELDRKPFDRALLEELAASLPAKARVLDVGCGAAAHIGRFLATRGAIVTGLDFSRVSLDVARGAAPELELVEGDMRAMPLPDASFDAVVAFYSLIYGSDDDVVAALRDIGRVLRPNGVLVAAVHGRRGGDEAGVERFSEYEGRTIDIALRITTPATFATLVERAALAIESVRVRSPYVDEHQTKRIYLQARRSS